MIIVKKPDELAAMRVAARKTATILHKVAAKVAPGVTTQELDEYAAESRAELQAQGRGKVDARLPCAVRVL